MTDLLLKEEVYAVVGAAIEVHREMGSGYHEPVYQECMEAELELRDIPFDAQHRLRIHYKGQALKQEYIPDLLCYYCLVVE